MSSLGATAHQRARLSGKAQLGQLNDMVSQPLTYMITSLNICVGNPTALLQGETRSHTVTGPIPWYPVLPKPCNTGILLLLMLHMLLPHAGLTAWEPAPTSS